MFVITVFVVVSIEFAFVGMSGIVTGELHFGQMSMEPPSLSAAVIY